MGNIYHQERKDTFVARYMSLQHELETANEWDFWGAIWLIANATDKYFYVDRPGMPVRMPFYVTFVADAGITRKTTAIKQARSVLLDADLPDIGFPGTGKSSLPGFLKSMTQPITSIVVPEMVTFFGKGSSVQMLEAITDMYDCPDEYRPNLLSEHRQIVVKEPYVHILAGSTPKWLGSRVDRDAIEGGFASRMLFITADRPKRRIPWSYRTPNDAIRKGLIDDLQQIRQTTRIIKRIELTNGAIDAYSKWYIKQKGTKLHYKLRTSEFVKTFEAREGDHVLRLAAFLSISDGRYEILDRHIRYAIDLIEHEKAKAAELFTDTVYTVNLSNSFDTIRLALMGAGDEGMAQNDLKKRLPAAVTREEFELMMELLHELDLVSKFIRRTGERGRPTTIWRGKDRLLNTNTSELARELRRMTA